MYSFSPTITSLILESGAFGIDDLILKEVGLSGGLGQVRAALVSSRGLTLRLSVPEAER